MLRVLTLYYNVASVCQWFLGSFVDQIKMDPQATESDLWILAKARLLDELDDNQKATFNEALLENLLYTTSNIQKRDADDSKTRSVLKKLDPLIRAIEEYGKTLDAYSNIAPLYLAPIWGSIRVVLAVANTHSRFYSKFVETLGRIGDALPRYSTSIFPSHLKCINIA